MEVTKSIDLGYATMHMRSDGILVFTPKPDLDKLKMEQLNEIFKTAMQLTEKKPSLLYVDTIKQVNLTDEEKNMVNNSLKTLIRACAIKVENPVVRFLIHSFNYLFQPPTPIKVFSNQEEAIEWLKTF